MSLLEVLSQATPIGPIPKNYPHLSELCRQAKISYYDHHLRRSRVTKNKKGEEKQEFYKVIFIEWRVELDSKPHPHKRRTATGKVKLDYNDMRYGTSEHAKFCAILEYIEHRGEMTMKDSGISGELNRENVLNVAIGKEPALKLPDGSELQLGGKVMKLKKMEWLEVSDECAGSGMRQYRVEKKKEKPITNEQLPF